MRREQKVWCIVFSENCIREGTMIRTAKLCRIKVGKNNGYIRDSEQIYSWSRCMDLYDKYGTEWSMDFEQPSNGIKPMEVCSSLDKALRRLHEEISNKKSEIQSLEYILATRESDDSSVLSQLRQYIKANVILRTEVGASALLVANFNTSSYMSLSDMSYPHIAETFNQKLHDVFGVTEGTFSGDEVIVQLGTHGMLFYIERHVFDRIIGQYADVAQRLQNIWNANNPYFGLEFEHGVDSINPKQFFTSSPRAISQDMIYEEMMENISGQMARVLAYAAKNHPENKSSNRPIQFVLTSLAADRNADAVVNSRNHIVMKYAGHYTQEKYYAISKHIRVKCYQRPNGTVYMRVECDPYNVRSISGREYVSMVSKGESILDTMIGYTTP